MVITGNYHFYLYFYSPFPFLPFPLYFYASQLEGECWKYYQLLCLCHDYIITVLSPTFLSYLSHLFAYELPRSNGIYLCITAFFASVLSTCQHLSVPTPLFPHLSLRSNDPDTSTSVTLTCPKPTTHLSTTKTQQQQKQQGLETSASRAPCIFLFYSWERHEVLQALGRCVFFKFTF